MGLGERIRERLEAKGMSQAELARRVGVSQPSINHLIRRGASGSSHLHKIAAVLETTPAYLSGQTDDPNEGFVAGPTTEEVAAELGLVPVRELDLTLGMGATFLDVPVTETIRHFPIDFLRAYTRSAPDKLFFAQGMGDSMEPTLRDTDLLLIDSSQRSINMAEKVWAITYAGFGAIKRLRPLPSGGVEMMADNPHVPNATAYDGEMQIMGRVVAVIRKV
ncbi:XRE family transcriptional regulator [Novosphingobium clariflavum]|uniref:XRE family transcriptional regulator n=1 Tax=Novosphingobium clariflavum TaxID=2029884 RepID=A0ABV6S3D0_9SPHN|nr:S24 family peptidase [Novosphingobium clariflavum]